MLALAPLLGAVVLVAVAVALRAQQSRQRRHLVGHVVAAATGDPAILFFTGATCTVCHTAQRPALERLAAELDGRVSVREIDVAEDPVLARQFKVMSLPTTVVLDGEGRASAVNVGFASAHVLRGQLVEAGLFPAGVNAA